jgi:hypothetical protein
MNFDVTDVSASEYTTLEFTRALMLVSVEVAKVMNLGRMECILTEMCALVSKLFWNSPGF